MDEDYVNSAMLIWQEGDIIREQWALEEEEIFIGRDEGCLIQISNRWISRTHARIWQDGNQYLLADANSKNGLYVNGQRISRSHVLSDGDTLGLAPGLDLIFVDSEAGKGTTFTLTLPVFEEATLSGGDDDRQAFV